MNDPIENWLPSLPNGLKWETWVFDAGGEVRATVYLESREYGGSIMRFCEPTREAVIALAERILGEWYTKAEENRTRQAREYQLAKDYAHLITKEER